jgi:hypothetical protein
MTIFFCYACILKFFRVTAYNFLNVCALTKGNLLIVIVPIFNTLFLIIYLLSAAVQYNDPDGLLWATVYLCAAGMCSAKIHNRMQRWLPPALLATSLLWIGTLVPRLVGHTTLADIFASISMQNKAVEEAREIGGLCLIALWASVLSLHGRR